MAFTMERWYAATAQRFAVRKYKEEPNEEELESLREEARKLSAHNVRIVIGYSEKAFAPILMGSGKVKGTGLFAAFLSKNAEPFSVGYLGETFILECTARGFGTCWLGIYNKKAVAAAIDMQKDETLTCITPIGIPAESYAARARKPLNKLTGLNQEQLQSLPEWQQHALECARRAPSATNAQPWKFLVEAENIRIMNTSSNYGFGKLDCGIAMLHLELGAAHGGVAGDWSMENGDAVFVPTSYDN